MDKTQIIESLIFTAEAPLKPEQIIELWQDEAFLEMGELQMEELEERIQAIQEKYGNEDSVFELKHIDGGLQFLTKRKFYPFVRHAAVQKNKKKLSRASLETLSIIAYRQPITKTEVEFIRGVNCDYAVRKLLDQKLVSIMGRSDAPGRPMLYGTSEYFMEYFGLNTLEDLPKLTEVSIDEGQFQEQFKVYMQEQKQENGSVLTDPPINEEN